MSPPPRYPLMLDLSGRRCLVVGGGAVAARKVRGLLESAAVVTVVAPELGAELAQRPDVVRAEDGGAPPAEGGQLTRMTWIDRNFVAGDLAAERGWWLVVAATDDRDVNRSIVEACDALGTWVVDASNGGRGSAITPAVHRDGPVTVAVSTSGVSPSAAAWLRDQLAAAIDPAVVVALELLSEIIREREAADADGERGDGGAETPAVSGHIPVPWTRTDWRRVLESGTLDDIRQGRTAKAKERLQACLSSSSD